MRAQRRAEPVHWYEPGGFWVLSKWEDVRYAGSHPALFSSRYGFQTSDAGDPREAAEQLQPWAREELSQPGLTAAQKRGIIARGRTMRAYEERPDDKYTHMILLDPPRHQEVRRVLTMALSAKLIASIGPLIADVTDDLLDRIRPGEVFDVVPIIGGIPAALIASLIGVPREMHDQFAAWATASMTLAALPLDAEPDTIALLSSQVDDFMAYAHELIEQRRAERATGDDLISAFLRSELDGVPITPELMLTYTKLIISGGSGTTKQLFSLLVHGLAEHPEQRELLRERPDLMANAIEETLRYYPVVWAQARTAMQDLELRGKQIRKDDYLLLAYASANRDEDAWENPDEYDITRPRRRHVAFGWGEHVCPGSSLVRRYAPIVLERMVSRFASWELAGTPERHSSLMLNGFITLPIRFH
jgi:cytochrome P450